MVWAHNHKKQNFVHYLVFECCLMFEVAVEFVESAVEYETLIRADCIRLLGAVAGDHDGFALCNQCPAGRLVDQQLRFVRYLVLQHCAMF